MNKTFSWLMILLLTCFFALFLFLPLCVVLKAGFSWDVLCSVLRNQLYLEGIWNATCVACVTTFLVFCFTLPLAILYDKYDFPGKSLCPVLMLLPMILPPFVGALGFRQLLGYYGVINTILGHCGVGPIDFFGGTGRFFSVCVMESLHLYPILYLNLVTSLSNIDPSYHEAAVNLGIPWSQRFRKITLPLLRPGIFAGGSIIFIWSFTELGTPLMFGYNTITPVQVYNGVLEIGSDPAVYGLVLVMLVVSCLFYLAGKYMLGVGGNAAVVKGMVSSSAKKLRGMTMFLPITCFLLFTLIAAAPHISLLLTAFSGEWYKTVLPLTLTLDHFRNALSDKLVIPSICNSLCYAISATVLACAAGLMTAWVAQRSKLRGRGAFDLVAMLPLMIPGLVMAIGFMGMVIEYPALRVLGDPRGNPALLIVAAYAIRRIPYVLRSTSSGLEQTPIDLELAARNMGCSPIRSFMKITFPLIMANVVVGGLFAFSFSMMEVSDSLMLAQKAEYYPITKAIYALSSGLGCSSSIGAAFGVWAMLFLASTFIASAILVGKKISSMFRL